MLRTIFSIGFIQVIGVSINTARAKVFALLLGPAGFGVVATIDQLVMSVSQFANLSIPFTAMKFLSHSHSLGEEQFRKSYSVFVKLITTLALVATVIAVLVLPSHLANLDPQLAKYKQPVLIALLGIPATMLLVFFVNVLASRQNTIQSISLNTLSSILLLVFGAIGCWLGGINGVYLAAVPASSALIIGMVVYARIKLKSPLHDSSTEPLRGFRANSRIIETAAFTYIAVNSYSALLLLARYKSITALSEEAAGLLQADLAIALSIGAVLAPANTLFFAPYVNRAIPALEKIAAADSFLPRLIFFYSLGSLPVLLFPELMLRVLFSHRFTGAGAVLPVFIIWQCLYQIANVYQQLLIGFDDLRGYAAVTIIGNAVAIVFCFRLIGQFGLAGVGTAFVIGAVAIAVLVDLRLRSKHKLAVPKLLYFLIVAVIAGLWGVALIGHMTVELTLLGLGARLLTALTFLGGLWLVLPKALRSELGVAVRARMLPGRTAAK